MDSREIKDQIEKHTGIVIHGDLLVVKDTTDFTKINRSMVLDLEGSHYVVLGDMYESRFTLEGFPKFWVKSAVELATGKKKIIKCVFNEEFAINIGQLNIKCYRSAEKESGVLKVVRGHPAFMQGETVHDVKGNTIRVIDFIQGENLYEYLENLTMDHQTYFFTLFPTILRKLRKSFEAIRFIHDFFLYHGDIRNDHIIIDQDTGIYRWIDFDLNQQFSDYDVWSLGNIMLFAAGKGEHTFRGVSLYKNVKQSTLDTLGDEDASAFFRYRIINLKKIFPYLPKKLNDILMHFSQNTNVFYDRVEQIIGDMDAVLDELKGDDHGNG
jgi:serine/threonine protein kinase